jgi:Leucine-rich repeat (LRR) protein
LKLLLLTSIIAGAAIGILFRAENTRKFALAELTEDGFSLAIDKSVGQHQLDYYWRYESSPGLLDDPPNNLLQKFGLTNLSVQPTYIGRVWSRKVKESNPKLQNDSLQALKAFSKVQILDLRWNPINDESLKNLAHLKQLETLRLDGTEITDSGLKTISGLKNLKHLSLYNTQVSDVGLSFIAKLEHLEDISLQGTNVTDKGVALFFGHEKLHSPNLTRTSVTGKCFSGFKANSNFKNLSLGKSKFDQLHIDYLISAFPNLEELHLASTIIDDTENTIREFKRLRRLDVSNTKVGDTFIATLAGLPLIGLWANSTNVTDTSSSIVQTMEHLEVFEINETNIIYELFEDE